MPLPLLLAAMCLGQDPASANTAAPATQEAPTFQTPFAVAEPNRLALTPKIDGVMEEEEWDALSSKEGIKGFLQWEPFKVHVAATVPKGQDLLISLDLRSDGWLVNKENVDVRITNASGSPQLVGRLLDATNVAGPTWVELPGLAMASKVAATESDAGTTYEVTLVDPNLGLFPNEDGRSMSVRLDALPSGTAALPPYLPRVLTPVKFGYKRAAAVPSNLRWNIEGAGNSVLPGSSIRLRYTFNGTDELGLQRLDLRSEGQVKETTVRSSVPFPLFDPKGRAFVDYETAIRPNADAGWRIAQGSLTDKEGVPMLIQGSYRVAPLIDLELVREIFRKKDREQRIKATYYIRSNSSRRVDGTVTVNPPSGFHMISAQDKGFVISSPRGAVRRVVEMDVPANSVGVYPLTLRVEIAGKMQDYTVYLNFAE